MAITINGSTGIQLEDNGKQQFGTGDDLQIFHDGTNSKITNSTGHIVINSNSLDITNAADNENLAKFDHDGGVELFYDNSKKFETTSSGTSVSGQLECGSVTLSGGGLALADNDQVVFGSGDDALAKHSGSDFLISNGTGVFEIKCTSGTGAGEGVLAFSSGTGTECARFISSGFLKAKGNSSSYHNTGSGYHELIGDTTHDVVAKLKHNSSTGYGLQTLFNHSSSSIYAISVRDYSNGNVDKAFIRCDGDLENANNSYGGTSDVKLKENIVDAKSQWDDIKALKVRNFNYKADENKTKFLGLVAQEAETVCPSLVKSQPDLGENNEDLGTETKVLKYSILYMKAVKALQEAITRIETLETKVAALEAA